MDVIFNQLPESFNTWTEFYKMLIEGEAQDSMTGYVMIRSTGSKTQYIISPDYLKARVLEEIINMTQSNGHGTEQFEVKIKQIINKLSITNGRNHSN